MKKIFLLLVFLPVLIYANSRGFDSVDDYINGGTNSSLNANVQMSVMAWIKPTTAGESSMGRIVDKTGTYNEGYNFHVYNPIGGTVKVLATVYHTAAHALRASSETFSMGQWHHVAFTYNRNGDRKVELYIDGVISSDSQSKDIAGVGTLQTGNTRKFGIGNLPDWTQRTFDGLIDEVSIWNICLSTAQIREYKDKHPIGSQTGLVGYYPLDEPAGDRIHDKSGNGNHSVTILGTVVGEQSPGRKTKNE